MHTVCLVDMKTAGSVPLAALRRKAFMRPRTSLVVREGHSSSMIQNLLNGLRSLGRKVLTEAVFSGEKSTSIHGWMSAQAICLRIFWRRFCFRNLKQGRKFKQGGGRSGKLTLLGSNPGPTDTVFACPLCLPIAIKPITCSTYYHLHCRIGRR